jgi:fructan beta-fructosidase
MNDPNGLVFFDGEYHLFYQHNPAGERWGHVSWGHAVSGDLVRWEHLPLALREEHGVMIFSGSAVVDRENTSGFGAGNEPPLVAIYTGHGEAEQAQNLASSTDRGRTWTKYPHNPVLAIGSREFRDPKVFWHAPTRRWIMVTALADRRSVRIDASPDLKRWTHLSDFGPAGAGDGPWECPDLLPLATGCRPEAAKWLLKVDVQGAVGARYFVGEFDGTRFTSAGPGEQALRVDHGGDFYAAQSWSDVPDGRRIWVGWLNHWDYAQVIPTSPWRGLLSIPRELCLGRSPGGLRLVQRPVPELASLRRLRLRRADAGLAATNAELGASSLDVALEIRVELALGRSKEAGLRVRKGAAEETVIGYDVRAAELFVDRRRSGDVAFSPSFAAVHRAPLAVERDSIALHVFVDACSVEVFGGDGRVVISDLIFPDRRSTGVELYADGDARVSALEIWELGAELPRAARRFGRIEGLRVDGGS